MKHAILSVGSLLFFCGSTLCTNVKTIDTLNLTVMYSLTFRSIPRILTVRRRVCCFAGFGRWEEWYI